MDSLSQSMLALQMGINAYLHQTLSDTSGYSAAQLRSILIPIQGEFRPADMLGTYLIENDLAGAKVLFDSMSTLTGLSESEEIWYDQAALFLNALDSMDILETDWTGLSEATMDSIEMLIGIGHPWTEAMAMHVMNGWFGDNYFYPAIWDAASPSLISNTIEEKLQAVEALPLMNVYPNPSQGVVHFRGHPTGAKNHQIWIMDAQGRTIHQQTISDQWDWNCDHCINGWYSYRIISDDGQMQTGKLSIIK